MDSNMTLLLTGILLGVGCTLIFGWLLRPRPKQVAEQGKVADPLTAVFREVEEERQTILKNFSDTYLPVAAGILIVMGVTVGAGLFGKDGVLTSSDNGYFANVFTELVSILVTVFVIDRLNRRRDEQRKVNEEKAQLLRDVRSTSNEIAKNAVHQMKERGWLKGDNGLLKGAGLSGVNLSGADLGFANLSSAFLLSTNLSDANLREANLSGAKLVDANLSGAKLGFANLSDANLGNANLSGANLGFANLSGAKLGFANLSGANLGNANLTGAGLIIANLTGAKLGAADLSGADLREANLSGAILVDANLSGADLFGANLSGADLRGAIFDEVTELPDETRWTVDTDMARFTDPQHPEFWRSDNKFSPAFRGALPPEDKRLVR